MTVKLNVLRPLLFQGTVYPPGATIVVDDEIQAVTLLESGSRVELQDKRDLPKLKAFAQAELARITPRTDAADVAQIRCTSPCCASPASA